MVTRLKRKMKTYISLSGLARRANLDHPSLVAKLQKAGISPDGLLLKESAPSGQLFDVEKLTEIRRAIAGAGAVRPVASGVSL